MMRIEFKPKFAIVARTLGGVYSTLFENEGDMDKALDVLRHMSTVSILREYRNENSDTLQQKVDDYIRNLSI